MFKCQSQGFVTARELTIFEDNKKVKVFVGSVIALLSIPIQCSVLAGTQM